MQPKAKDQRNLRRLSEEQRDHSTYDCHRCQKKGRIARDRPEEPTESPVKVWTWALLPAPVSTRQYATKDEAWIFYLPQVA